MGAGVANVSLGSLPEEEIQEKERENKHGTCSSPEGSGGWRIELSLCV